MNRAYFPVEPGAPEPLRMTVTRQVRFEEVDSLGIVWHGRYAGYFEDARVALLDRHGIGYMDFLANRVIAPIRQLHVDYRRPLRFRDEFAIESLLHWTEAARINMEFVLRDAGGTVTTTGFTVQMMADMDGNTLMVPPPFFQAFVGRWRQGTLA